MRYFKEYLVKMFEKYPKTIKKGVPKDLLNDPPEMVYSSTEDEMGEYGTHFSKVPSHFLHAITLAQNNEKDLKGIVVNAFSEPFVLEREIYDIVEKMKSRLSE